MLSAENPLEIKLRDMELPRCAVCLWNSWVDQEREFEDFYTGDLIKVVNLDERLKKSVGLAKQAGVDPIFMWSLFTGICSRVFDITKDPCAKTAFSDEDSIIAHYKGAHDPPTSSIDESTAMPIPAPALPPAFYSPKRPLPDPSEQRGFLCL